MVRDSGLRDRVCDAGPGSCVGCLVQPALGDRSAGLGVSLLGVTGTTVWRNEALTVVAPGQTLQVGPYTLRFDGVTREKGPNYIADRAHVAIMDGGKVSAVMLPEHRFYPDQGQDQNDTAIHTTGLFNRMSPVDP